jgi:hypothetical protein
MSRRHNVGHLCQCMGESFLYYFVYSVYLNYMGHLVFSFETVYFSIEYIQYVCLTLTNVYVM